MVLFSLFLLAMSIMIPICCNASSEDSVIFKASKARSPDNEERKKGGCVVAGQDRSEGVGYGRSGSPCCEGYLVRDSDINE